MLNGLKKMLALMTNGTAFEAVGKRNKRRKKQVAL